MTDVAQNRVSLFEEVEDLRKDAKKHLIEFSNANDAKGNTVSKVDETLSAIKEDQKGFWVERNKWSKETKLPRPTRRPHPCPRFCTY